MILCDSYAESQSERVVTYVAALFCYTGIFLPLPGLPGLFVSKKASKNAGILPLMGRPLAR